MKIAIAALLSLICCACVDEYEPTLGDPCDTSDDCPAALECTAIQSGPICSMKCDSEQECADLGGSCGWAGIEYPGGAVVDSFLCLPADHDVTRS